MCDKRGLFVVIDENDGSSMIYKVLIDDTDKIICHSNICYVRDPQSPNLRLGIFGGESSTSLMKSRHGKNKEDQHMMVIVPVDMKVKILINRPLEHGERHFVCIVKEIKDTYFTL